MCALWGFVLGVIGGSGRGIDCIYEQQKRFAKINILCRTHIIIGIRTKQSIEYNSCGTLSFRNISEDIFSKYAIPNSLIINNLYYFIRFYVIEHNFIPE